MPIKLLEKPGRRSANFNSDETVLQAGHPWLLGRVIRVGTAKMDHIARADIRTEFDRLLAAAPTCKEEVPPKIRAELVRKYFKHMPKIAKPEKFKPSKTIESLARIKEPVRGKDDARVQLTIDYHQANKKLLIENERLNEKIRDLENRIEGMTSAVGEQTADEKSLPLKVVWLHWAGGEDAKGRAIKGQLRCRNGKERKAVVRRVMTVLSALDVSGKKGLAVRYGDVTMPVLQEALDNAGRTGKNLKNQMATREVSPKERAKRVYDVRRMFRDVCLSPVEGGLGFKNNPARTIKADKRSMQKGAPEIMDPAKILHAKGIDIKWKALVAIIGYGGIRLNEAAALTWDKIDSKRGLIDVLESDAKPEMKSSLSYRTVRPFLDVWAWIEKLRGRKKRGGYLFTRSDGSSWFEEGNDASSLLSNMLGVILERKLGHRVPKPVLKLRHWWETTMRSSGNGDLIETMGGHDDAMGRKLYSNRREIVLKRPIGYAGKGN